MCFIDFAKTLFFLFGNFLKIESLGGDGKVIPDKVAFIDTKTHELLKRSQIKSGDILFSIAGFLGRIALVDENIVPANTNQALAIIRLKNDSELQNNYLFWYLNHSHIQNHINTISVQGAQANLSLQNIADFEIQMPKAQTQIDISELLNNVEQSIQLLITKLQKLKHQKQGMMQALLTGKIRLI
jgi:type I restriction enzyme S subunit